LYNGRVRPSDVSTYFDIAPKTFDEAALMADLAAGKDPATVFAALEPQHPEYLALKAALAAFEDPATTPPPRIADGPVLRLGTDDPRVPVIRERLHVASIETGTTYDQGLFEAITAFQTSQGLEPDGIVGPATVAALNGG